ncbi:unnamed protein product [Acanthoscelides obtectus]|uniref:YqaJ viral recombinase domain-containing protein n=1 Tax=Acanthoscelides obtectus TaxID=200917 RepID=A0A9P0Q853_ACAOB|nr:unnamed protein product [Acanthoscelides obtectus]CAK1624212.1 hypothetical protein AOBTE_LOCUS2407 [Acanthoscelides obtectus]
MFWLLRRSTEPSVTSVECYWRKPTLAKVGSSLKAAKLNELFKNVPPVASHNNSFLKKLLEKGLENKSKGILFEYYKTEENAIDKVSLYHLINKFVRNSSIITAENFIQYCQQEMNDQPCKEILNQTKDQSNTGTWFEIRYARITASKFYEAAQSTTYDGCLVESILGAAKFKSTKAMKRGLSLDDKVLKVVARKKLIKVEKVGIFVDKRYPIFGASPDAVNAEFCIEIKCPSKESTLKQYLNDGVIGKKPFAQIQLQMLLSGRKKGLFCVASPNFEVNKDVSIVEVELDIFFCCKKQLCFGKKLSSQN